MPLPVELPSRLYALDALRGGAALAVVFWHWQHFFFVGDKLSADFVREAQPFYEFFGLFYRHGWLAVDLFFCLSGFVFFWLYAKSITQREILPKEFFVLRGSRLYPLHIFTLLVVALGQVLYVSASGVSFVYSHNDIWHLILNVFMLSSVGLEKGYSFNAPIWSVSVEIFMYAIFFVLCWFKRIRLPYLLILFAFGLTFLSSIYLPIGRGLTSFFLGGSTFYLLRWMIKLKSPRSITNAVIFSTSTLWIATAYVSYIGNLPIDIKIDDNLSNKLVVIILFPGTIISMALIEVYWGVSFKKFAFLGEISYSAYLWHFPLQLLFAVALFHFGVPTKKHFLLIEMFALYFFTLIVISLWSYRYFERPMQNYIRRRWLPAADSVAVAG